jgi:hypothetical protein
MDMVKTDENEKLPPEHVPESEMAKKRKKEEEFFIQEEKKKLEKMRDKMKKPPAKSDSKK